MSAAELIDLVRALVWPVFVTVLLIIFRKQLRNFADRLTHIRVGGQEFVASTLETSQVLLRSVPLTLTRPESVPRAFESEVLQLASADPHTALIRLGREIDRSVRLVAVAGNWLEPMERQANPLWRRLVQLGNHAGWDADVLASTLIFSILEEAAVSGNGTMSTEDMKRLVDQGLTVLGLINSIPRETHFVIASSLAIYEDEKLTRPIPDRFAVCLKSISDDGRETVRAFLTSRPDYYKPGMTVGYEWKNNPPTEELHGWTADPTSDTPDKAISVIGWDFQGRNLAEFN